MLLDLDHPAAAPVPVLADVRSTDVTFRPANLITLLPYPGHPLAPNTRYAAALFDGVRDAAGNRLAPAPILTQLDGSAPSGVSPTRWDQLRLDRDDLVAATPGERPGAACPLAIVSTERERLEHDEVLLVVPGTHHSSSSRMASILAGVRFS